MPCPASSPPSVTPRLTASLLAGCLAVVVGPPVAAQDAPAETRPLQTPGNDDRQPAYPPRLVQPGDDPPERANPVVPRDEATSRRLDAMALFMQGQVHERRRELIEAYDSYRRAIELDDSAAAIYRSYVPLAYVLGDADQAIAAARRTAAIHDDGHTLLQALAAIMSTTGRGEEAATLLTESLNIPRIRDRRIASLLIRRDLGKVMADAGRWAEAAQQFQLVFAALPKDEATEAGVEDFPSDGGNTEPEPSDEAGEADTGQPDTDKPGTSKPSARSAQSSLSAEDREQLLGSEPFQTYELIGRTFLQAELPDLAVAAFDRAAAFQESPTAVHSYNLATVYEQQGEYQKALDSLDQYLKAELRSKGVAAYELLGSLYRSLGREADLLPRLAELVEADRLNQTLRFYYAGQLLAAGRIDEAAEQYDRGLGGSSDPRGLVGRLAIARQRQNADAVLDQLLALYPRLPQVEDRSQLDNAAPDVRAILSQYYAELDAITADGDLLDAVLEVAGTRLDGEELDESDAVVIGKVLLQAERPSQSLPFYRKAIALGENALPLLVEVGDAFSDADRPAEAAAVYAEARETLEAASPAHLALSVRMAHNEELAGNTDRAIELLDEAAARQPDNFGLLYERAWVAYHAKRWPDAIEQLEGLIARADGDGSDQAREVVRLGTYLLSSAYVKNDNFDAGADLLERALAKDPTNVQANNDLGYLYADAGQRLDRALELIQKAVQAEPDNPAYLDSLGWVYFKLGRFDDAIGPLEKAAAGDTGQDAVIYDHLAQAQAQAGRADAAIESYRTAMRLVCEGKSSEEGLGDRIAAALAELTGEPAESFACGESDD